MNEKDEGTRMKLRAEFPIGARFTADIVLESELDIGETPAVNWMDDLSRTMWVQGRKDAGVQKIGRQKISERHCPTIQIATEAELAKWLPTAPRSELIKSIDLLTRLTAPFWGKLQWDYVLLSDGKGNQVFAVSPAPKTGKAAVHTWTLTRIQSVWEAMTLGAEKNNEEEPTNPNAQLIYSFQKRSFGVVVDAGSTGIVPSHAAVKVQPADILRADESYMPSSASKELYLKPVDKNGQRWLPGLSKNTSRVSALQLALYRPELPAPKGPGAPLRNQLYFEALTLAAVQARKAGERFYLTSPSGKDLVISDLVDWAAWNINNYRSGDKNYGIALDKAMKEANSLELPLNNRGGWLRSVFFEGVEGRRPNDRIAVSVRLWTGSELGAKFDRIAMRLARKASAIAHRSYIAVICDWNDIAENGKVPGMEIPEYQTNEAGYLINSKNEVIIQNRKPLKEGPHPHAIETGEMLPNPKLKLHKVYYKPKDTVHLAFPFWMNDQYSKAAILNIERTIKSSITALRWLARECDDNGDFIKLNGIVLPKPAIKIQRLRLISKESNEHGFPWRIWPPDTDLD